MVKHKIDKIVIYKGKTYLPKAGIVTLPEAVELYNPIEEDKRNLNSEAIELGLEGEELAKFKRKNKAAKEKYLEKIKEAK